MISCTFPPKSKLIDVLQPPVAWCKSFDLEQGKDVDVRVPFTEFIPVFRGTTLKTQNNPIDQKKVFSVQIMVSKYEYDGALNPNFTEGAFQLEFGNIRAYK